jgi:Ni,Fe-hydrogenase I small subunit
MEHLFIDVLLVALVDILIVIMSYDNVFILDMGVSVFKEISHEITSHKNGIVLFHVGGVEIGDLIESVLCQGTEAITAYERPTRRPIKAERHI